MEQLNFTRNVAQRLNRIKEIVPQEVFEQQMRRQTKQLIQGMLEEALNEEMDLVVGASRYERTTDRRFYRKGYYCRDLTTTLGRITGFKVPRTTQPMDFEVLERYQRRSRLLDEAIVRNWLYGGSTRGTSRFFGHFFGQGLLSPTTVSRLSRRIDQEVHTFHRRKLSDCYVGLILDALWVRVRSTASPQAVLGALGITAEGRYELIAFRVARSEAEVPWTSFCQELVERGLVGTALQIVAIDEKASLKNAVAFCWPKAPIQTCRFHKLATLRRNLLGHSQRREILKEASRIYQAPTARAALTRATAWHRRWKEVAPRAARCFWKGVDDTFQFYALPSSWWHWASTTNALERFWKKIRSKTRGWGSFQDAASCEAILFALTADYNQQQYQKGSPLKQNQSPQDP